MTLFDERQEMVPLATRLRPSSLEEFAGQEHLLGKGKILRQLIEKDQISSMIFWGPPGVGKTTLASIIAGRTKAEFINFSAVTSGIKEIRSVMEAAEMSRRMGRKTLLFVDEIHRFNKAQQDAFLPYVEKGSIILIGATTENPSFEVNAALLSRCRVFVLKALGGRRYPKIVKACTGKPQRIWYAESTDRRTPAFGYCLVCKWGCQDSIEHAGNGGFKWRDFSGWHYSCHEGGNGTVYQQKTSSL